MVCVAIVTMWIILPAFYITMGSLSTDIIDGTCMAWVAYSSYAMGSLSTDIIDGTCMAWVAYSSYALEKTIMSLSTAVAYIVPLTAMLFCYSRIVYALRHKVIRLIVYPMQFFAWNGI